MNLDYIKNIATECLEKNKIETDFLEYKKSNSQKGKILKSMCAFANNLMNRELCLILIGVGEHSEDKLKGTPIRPISGFNESEVETIENSIKSLIPYVKPKMNFDITHTTIDARALIIVAFSNNNNGPYEVVEKAEIDKSINLKRGRYVRIERESRLATVFEEFNLLKKFANYHFTEEFSHIASLNNLDVDYIREYLTLTTNRNNTSVLSKYEMAKNMNLLDTSTNLIRNYSILMFSRNPEEFIPYSYVELIYRSSFGESLMQSKEYRGPIWKQLKNVMDDIKNNYIHSITLRIKDEVESKTIYNYPYSTIEELMTNAIVHKNYENPRTIQIYIYEDSIVITNYNKPIPPITIKDLNEFDSFPNRSYENPTIREMFKALDYIESYGSGIGKAKRAMERNGTEKIHFKEYDENIDITSVKIPINEKYNKFRKMDIQNKKMDIGDEKLDIGDEKLDIGDEKLDIGDEKLDINLEIKINTIDVLERINKSTYSKIIKNNILKIYNKYFNNTFSRSNVLECLGVSSSMGSNYINYLFELDIIEPIKGQGKGKYRFK